MHTSYSAWHIVAITLPMIVLQVILGGLGLFPLDDHTVASALARSRAVLALPVPWSGALPTPQAPYPNSGHA